MEYFIGQIILFAGKDTPIGWMPCNGQMLQVAAYRKLYDVISDTYGSGADSFALPDLRGKALVHPGSNSTLGTKGGEIEKNFSSSHFPPHSHTVMATIKSSSKNGNKNTPINNYPANSFRDSEYHTTASDKTMSPSSIDFLDVSTAGTRHLKPLTNMQPYLPVNFIIKVN